MKRSHPPKMIHLNIYQQAHSCQFLAPFTFFRNLSVMISKINPLKWLMGKRIAIFKVYLYDSKSWKLRLLVTECYIL